MARAFLRATALASIVSATMSAASAAPLEIAVSASPAGLDPHIATAFATFEMVNGTIYEGLTSVDQDLKVAPGLASSWTISDDGKKYTFKLRPGVTFHDGSPLTADDVAATVRRIQSKDIASPLASRLTVVESATAVDPTTIELKLTEPSAPLLGSLATIAIVPKAVETNKDALQKAPDGTGPFKFQEWSPNGSILLVRNDKYWGGAPKLDGLKFNIVPESATRQVGLVNKQFSLLPNTDPATALQVKGKPGVKLDETLELAYTMIGMNAAKPPFDNAKVREAVNYALNRDQIIQAALFGAGVPAGPLSPALKEWAVSNSQFACYKPDAAKAKALLAEAGVKIPLEVTINVLPRQDIKDIAQVVQEQLNNAGFKVTLNVQELGQFVQDWRNGKFELFASANAGNVDPDDYFYRTFRTGGSTNVFKYSDPAVDALLDGARSSQDKAKRKADYDKLQSMLACSGPIAHIAYATLFSATSDKLTGFRTLANRSLSTLKDASLGQ
ncbi:ABC transporter substrate-binding protein [soil metagenome]